MAEDEQGSDGEEEVPDSEKLDAEEAVRRLYDALRLQYRSALQYTLTSGSLFGFEFQAFGDRFWEFAQAELRWTGDPGDAVEWIVETESEAVEALKDAIEPTGREGRSEALEHLMEHLILRKQNQIDFLLRARRTS